MVQIEEYKEFKIIPLTKDLANKYSAAICTALALIPSVEPRTPEQLLAENKGERALHKKWEHSLIALKEDQFAGVIIGYERESENTDQYPHHSIYVSDFAVAAQYQRKGLGTFLVKNWLDYNQQKGFLELNGDLRFSIQTNSADWN